MSDSAHSRQLLSNSNHSSNQVESVDIYESNVEFVRLLRWFILVDIAMVGCAGFSGYLMYEQMQQVPSVCSSQMNELFFPYTISFAVGMLYFVSNLYAVRSWKSNFVKVINMLFLVGTLGLKGYFVVLAAAMRNRNIGKCFLYADQNLFFIVQGSFEVGCILLTVYLMFSLIDQLLARGLSGKLGFFSLVTKFV